MRKKFKDFYGCIAEIASRPEGARLKMWMPTGKKFWDKTYSTERGARIAMGKMSDAWRAI